MFNLFLIIVALCQLRLRHWCDRLRDKDEAFEVIRLQSVYFKKTKNKVPLKDRIYYGTDRIKIHVLDDGEGPGGDLGRAANWFGKVLNSEPPEKVRKMLELEEENGCEGLKPPWKNSKPWL